MFKTDSLNEFASSLWKTKDKRKLKAGTLYGYIRTLTFFFEWKVNALGKEQFRALLDALLKTGNNLSNEKHWETNTEAKEARFAKLPSVPDFLEFLKGELRDKAVQARLKMPDASQTEAINLYLDLRNYILFALLFGVPPQRLQVFDSVKIDEVQYKNKYTILSANTHQTSPQYGTAVIALPPFYYEEFKALEAARSELVLVKFDDGRLFIGRDGKPEKNLTKRFQSIVSEKFKVNVSIHDCRSLYVTHAGKYLDLTQLYELSRQMCHSFQTQQTVYRTENNIQRAITQLDTSGALTELMPLCNIDCAINNEEEQASDIADVDNSVSADDFAHDDESESEEDFYGGVSNDALLRAVEQHNSQHDNKI